MPRLPPPHIILFLSLFFRWNEDRVLPSLQNTTHPQQNETWSLDRSQSLRIRLADVLAYGDASVTRQGSTGSGSS